MRYLLDTSVLVQALDAPEGLPVAVLSVLRDAANLPFGVSAITPWEIAVLAGRGRLRLGRPIGDWLALALRPEFVALLPMIPEIAVESAALPGPAPSEPADRIIVATARHHGLILLTADPGLLAYPHARTRWEGAAG